MDTERIGRRNGQAGNCGEYLTSACWTIAGGSDTQATPVGLLVESPPDPAFDDKVSDICQTYLNASERANLGERTLSLDEMSGIQALERKAKNLPMRPGRRERQEFEYIRHGTQTLIASFDVASGQVVHATVGNTRTEADYLAHIQQTLATAPDASKWHLVMDCLNILRIIGAVCRSS